VRPAGAHRAAYDAAMESDEGPAAGDPGRWTDDPSFAALEDA
jgi:hypothetical protein